MKPRLKRSKSTQVTNMPQFKDEAGNIFYRSKDGRLYLNINGTLRRTTNAAIKGKPKEINNGT